MANNSFTECYFVDGELWSNATYNTSSSTRKSAMCNFETTPVLCAHLHKFAGEGSRCLSDGGPPLRVVQGTMTPSAHGPPGPY